MSTPADPSHAPEAEIGRTTTTSSWLALAVIILAGVLLIAWWLARPEQDRSVTGDLAGS